MSSEKKGLDAEIEASRAAKYDKQAEAKAIEWIRQVTGEPLTKGFFADLQNGVVLCKIVNRIKPGCVPKIIQNPKHFLESRANINAFISACVELNVESSDMITPLDLGESSKDVFQLQQCIFALSRRAQALGTGLPSLGPNYYRSAEDEERIRLRKEERAKQAAQLQKIEEERARQRREQLELEKDDRRKTKIFVAKQKMEQRQKHRSGLPGSDALARHESNVNEESLNRLEDSTILYGMDLETQLRNEERFDDQAERDVLDWIEAVTQEQVDHIWLHLKSGRLLCKLINKIRPGTIKKINKQQIALVERENLQSFCRGCVSFGVSEQELFNINDFHNGKDLNGILKTIMALERCTNHMPNVPEMSRTFTELDDKENDRSGSAVSALKRNFEKKLCPACKAPCEPGRTFCAECGAKVNYGTPAGVVTTTTTQTTPLIPKEEESCCSCTLF